MKALIMKNKISPFFIIFILLLAGCSEQENNNKNKYDLTRVDVYRVNADEKYDEEVTISDKSAVDDLSRVFEQIVWEQNVKAEMARREDLKVVLFREDEKHMPERLVYYIWFEQNGAATIINRDENSFGKLDEKNVNILKSKFNFVDE